MKSFFDINSHNTFNRWDPWEDRSKAKVWPPWLTLPVHYYSDIWRKVIESYILVGGNEYVIRLECNHSARISLIEHHDWQEKSFKFILVNCRGCGGSGEIRRFR